MTEKQLTLADSMAISVLKGDRVAAYALAELLMDEVQGSLTKEAMAYKARSTRSMPSIDARSVYISQEFQAFCDRFGILWDLRTLGMTIHLPSDGILRVEQSYIGSNVDPDGSVIPEGHTSDVGEDE